MRHKAVCPGRYRSAAIRRHPGGGRVSPRELGFWARGYFCVTADELTKEMIQEYLSHHFEPNAHDGFDVEP